MHHQKVREFHEKHGFFTDARLSIAHRELDPYTDAGQRDAALLWSVGNTLVNTLYTLELAMMLSHEEGNHQKALLFARLRLMVEELSEIAYALRRGHEVDLLDGLADLIYVTYGTAVAFDLPLDEAIGIVHRSNMSKDVGEFKPVKGDDYVDPAQELSQLLKRHRETSKITQHELPFEEKST
ncbi:ntP-ppase-like protein [Caudoviricetes sp.]|nr:ntP-ppase-like protein [Caudoviricetes sp.]UOF82728.1 ntP-ppase-like protein [Caudoviricetes sp.]